jgi:hypothetical protein
MTDLYRSLPIIIKRSTGPLQMSAKDDSFKLMRKDTRLLQKFDLSSPTSSTPTPWPKAWPTSSKKTA